MRKRERENEKRENEKRERERDVEKGGLLKILRIN